MVFYELVLTTKPHVPFWQLTDLMKTIAHSVVKNGGIVRAIHNHGVREIPVRMQAKFTDMLGRRYFDKGRFISVYMDCNPRTRESIDKMLSVEEDVLRQTHLRARSILDAVNVVKEKDNPFMQRMERQQYEENKLKQAKELQEQLQQSKNATDP